MTVTEIQEKIRQVNIDLSRTQSRYHKSDLNKYKKRLYKELKAVQRKAKAYESNM